MIEGQLVMIVGKFDTRIKDMTDDLRIGTFWSQTLDKKVLVLLANGSIYLGNVYDVIAYKKELE